MQDRTPAIVDPGTRISSTYTGNYPAKVLDHLRRSEPRGDTLAGILDSLGARETEAYVHEALEHLEDCSLASCAAREQAPEVGHDHRHIWKVVR